MLMEALIKQCLQKSVNIRIQLKSNYIRCLNSSHTIIVFRKARVYEILVWEVTTNVC